MSEKVYVEQSAVLEALQAAINKQAGKPDALQFISDILDAPFALPPASIAPIVKGEWITKEYMYGDKNVGQEDMWIERLAEKGDTAYCSVCGCYALLNGGEEYVLSDFCPSCGAAMSDEAVKMLRERSNNGSD